MAITTLDGALAGMQAPVPFAKAATPTLVAGRPHSLWYLAGFPGAGSMDSTTSGGVQLSSTSSMVAGQLTHTDPGAGNSYLGRLQAMATIPGTLMLCDRLWHGADIIGGTVISVTSTSAQTITSFPGLPARDRAASSNGDGVLIGVEVYSALGAGTPTITLGYTNQAGTASRSATNVDAVVASSAVGAFYRMGLQAGDTGVRSVQSLQLSATMTSGNIGLVAYRVLAQLELTAANVPNAIDALTAGFPRIPNGAVPFLLFIPSTTTASNISGTYAETQG
jgi:hypothetical protein